VIPNCVWLGLSKQFAAPGRDMTSKILVDLVPHTGPLSLGAIYRRGDLHTRFGGSRFSGIVPSKREPVILLFHTQEPAQQFYRDGFDGDGIYWYSAEGSSGDMTWTPSNRAVRDQAELGLDLFFFERVQRKDGLWRFAQIFYYFSHKQERRPDKTGSARAAIVFGLLSITSDSAEKVVAEGKAVDPSALRIAAMATVDPEKLGVRSAIRNVYFRSEAVRQYALVRAGGKCEACSSVAPFKNIFGAPFLEVHHIDRLADSGPDRVDRVAAICPNCHRRCHYSSDRLQYNSELRAKISAIERLSEPR
jgi:5-methylcytosine-specific restriction enzyme A